MKVINEDIKKMKFKPVYLLYGDETYLKQQYKKKLLTALCPEEDSMNVASYEGKGINEGEVIDLAETMPFFADRRVILLSDTGWFKGSTEKMADYLKNLPEYLVMIFVESEVDKRSRMYKAVKSAGRITEFGIQDEKTLLTWVAQMLGREHKNITRVDGEYLLSKTGTDMNNIVSELDKLVAYTHGREVITREDIDQVCTEQIEGKIFDMLRAVTEKNQEVALHYYYDLLALREPAMRILYMMGRQYNQLLQVKALMKQGYGQSQIASTTAMHPFVVKNCMALVKKYRTRQLEQAVELCVQSEEDIKSGRLGDELAVELVLVQLTQ